eukprot:1251447-Lingulodinium_polyedra.AAC.1
MLRGSVEGQAQRHAALPLALDKDAVFIASELRSRLRRVKKGHGHGGDCIPGEVFALAPEIFARALQP